MRHSYLGIFILLLPVPASGLRYGFPSVNERTGTIQYFHRTSIKVRTRDLRSTKHIHVLDPAELPTSEAAAGRRGAPFAHGTGFSCPSGRAPGHLSDGRPACEHVQAFPTPDDHAYGKRGVYRINDPPRLTSG